MSPLSLLLRAFFLGVVDAILTGVEGAEDSGEPTLVSTVSRIVGGNDDLGIAFENGELDVLLVSLTSDVSPYPFDDELRRRLGGVALTSSATGLASLVECDVRFAGSSSDVGFIRLRR